MKYRTRRRLTTFEVPLHNEWGEFRASIVDVTERGARLRLPVGNLAPESPVSLSVRGENIAAHVVWIKEEEVGIAFDSILPIDVLATINRNMRRSRL